MRSIKPYKSAITALILFAVILAVSCITSEGDSVDLKVASVIMPLSEKDDIPEGLDFLLLIVTGPDMNKIVRRLDLDTLENDESPSFEINVLAGSDRFFRIAAFSDDHIIAYEGSEILDLYSGREQFLNIDLYGKGYISGTVYYLDESENRRGDPLKSYTGPTDSILHKTDSDGDYLVKLSTQSEPYEISLSDVSKNHETKEYETNAQVLLPTGGTQVELDLYLVPQNDFTRPWICAVYPMSAAPGDTVEIFGRGFEKGGSKSETDLRNDNLTIFFKQEGEKVASPLPAINDDTHLSVKIPSSLNSGNAEIYIQWESQDKNSNLAPITITP